jgi:hypothetical protein
VLDEQFGFQLKSAVGGEQHLEAVRDGTEQLLRGGVLDVM